MCTYARTVFKCRHQTWGRRLKLCTVAENHLAGDCGVREPHGLHSRRIPRQCDKCSELDRKRSLVRAKLDECRNLLRRQCPSYGLGLGLGIGAGGDTELGSDGRCSVDEFGADDGGFGSGTTGGKGFVLGV